jgi:hypothetical protein
MFHQTLYTSMCIFHTMSWNMIARTWMTTCVSLHTPHLVISSYAWCNQVMYITWKTVDFTVGGCKSSICILENTTQTNITHHCTYYTQIYRVWLEDCLQRELALLFTLHLLTSSSIDANTTIIWQSIPANQTCNLESLGESGTQRSVSNHKWISKMRFTSQHCAYL